MYPTFVYRYTFGSTWLKTYHHRVAQMCQSMSQMFQITKKKSQIGALLIHICIYL